jgi:hypothetical protein
MIRTNFYDSLIVVGSCQATTGPLSTDALVMGLDTNGTVQWARSVGTSAPDETAVDIIELSNGGYAVAGQSADQCFVFKLNANGDLLWSWVYDLGAPSHAVGIAEGPSGGVIVGGTVGNPGEEDLFWIRLSLGGTVIDARRYGSPGPDEATDMISTYDGGFAFTGYTTPDTAQPAIQAGILVKVDEFGLFQWGRLYQATSTTL